MAERMEGINGGEFPSLQHLPQLQEVQGKFVGDFVTAPELANFWVIASRDRRPARDDFEAWESITFEAETEEEAGDAQTIADRLMLQWTGEGRFKLKPGQENDFLTSMRQEHDLEHWRIERGKAQEQLQIIINLLNNADAMDMKDFSQALNLLTRQRTATLSDEADREFARLIKEISQTKEGRRNLSDKALHDLLHLVREEYTIYEDLVSDKSWTELNPVTRNHIRMHGENWQLNKAKGEAKRLGILLMRIRQRGTGTPWRILRGREKAAIIALQKLEKERLRLVEETDLEKKEKIIDKMIFHLEDREVGLFSCLATATGNYKEAEQIPPVGIFQVITGAKERFRLLDSNRESSDPNNPLPYEPMNPTYFYGQHSWFTGSWQNGGEMEAVISEDSFLANALARLTVKHPPGTLAPNNEPAISGEDEFLKYFATDPLLIDPDNKKYKEPTNLRYRKAFFSAFLGPRDETQPLTPEERKQIFEAFLGPVERMERELKKIKEDWEAAKQAREAAKEQVDDAREELEAALEEYAAAHTQNEVMQRQFGLLPPDPNQQNNQGQNQNQNRGFGGNPLMGINLANQISGRFASAQARLRKARKNYYSTEFNVPPPNSPTESGATYDKYQEARKKAKKLKKRYEEKEQEIEDLKQKITASKQQNNPIPLDPDLQQQIDTTEANIQRAKQIEYDQLVARIEAYLKNTTDPKTIKTRFPFDDTLPDQFTDSEVALFKELTGMDLSPKHVDTGRVIRKDGTEQILPWARVNVWSVAETNARGSHKAIPQMMRDRRRFKDVVNLVENNPGQGILFCGFAAVPDVTGGIEEGRFNEEEWQKLIDKHQGSVRLAMGEWFDDLEIQRKIGYRPEDLELRALLDFCDQYLVRHVYFPADKRYTGWKLTVQNGTKDGPETIIKKMVAAGKPLTSQTLQSEPFNYAEVTNENSFMIVDDSDDSLLLQLLWRDKDITKEFTAEGAPQTLVELLAKSIENKIRLVQRHEFAGAQPPGYANLSTEQLINLGGYMRALTHYLRDLLLKLDFVKSGPVPLPTDPADPDFRPEAIQRLEGLIELHRQEIVHLTYDVVSPDILDDNGNLKLIPQNSNKAFEPYWQEYRTVHGRLNSALGKRMAVYVNTFANENATDAQKTQARQSFLNAMAALREDMTYKLQLGEQACGKLPSADRGDASRFIAERHMDHFLAVSLRAFVEACQGIMYAREGYTVGVRPDGNILGNNAGKVFNRIQGLLTFSGTASNIRRMEFLQGGRPNLLINRLEPFVVGIMEKDKVHGAMMWLLAGLIAHAIQTQNQRGFDGLFFPEPSDVRYRSEDRAPSLQLGETGQRILNSLWEAMKKEGADNMDREPHADPIDKGTRPRKELGASVYDMMDDLYEAVLRDTQWVDALGELHVDGKPIGQFHAEYSSLQPGNEGRTLIHHAVGMMLEYVERALTDPDWVGLVSEALNTPISMNTDPAIVDSP